MFWPRQENTQNQSSGSLLVPFGGQGTEMLKTRFLEGSCEHLMAKPRKSSNLLGISWEHFVNKARKCSNSTFSRLPGGNAIGGEDTNMFLKNQPSGDLLGPFYGQDKKILKTNLLKLPGTIWWPRRENYLNQPVDPESR